MRNFSKHTILAPFQIPTAQLKMTDNQKEEIMIDELLMAAIEEEAAKYEVTVDYYMEEFM